MRIALLTWFFPPGGSGLSRAAYEIANGVKKTGAEVVVFSAAHASETAYEIDGLKVVGCAPPRHGPAPVLRRLPMLGHLVAPWYFRKAFLRTHVEAPFDVIEATNWYAPAALLAAYSTPLVIRNSTPAIDAKSDAMFFRDRADLWFANLLERWTARQATALISNTASHKALIEKLYQPVATQLHEVVSLALDPQTLRRARSSEPPSCQDKFSLLFIGRAERRKGFDEMLEAFLRFNRNRHANGQDLIGLTVVGLKDSELAVAVEKSGGTKDVLASIHSYASVPDDLLYDLYEQTTAVIAPSRYESYGLVYREAAAFGRPLIACAEDPAAVEFIKDADCGVLAETCSSPDISKAIENLVADRDLCDRLGRAGQKYAQRLSRQRLGHETRAIYEYAWSFGSFSAESDVGAT